MLDVERTETYKKEICLNCGKFFKITNGEKSYYESLGRDLPTWCRSCRDKGKKIIETRTCRDCGDDFTISVAEKEMFDKKGWKLPVRCRACRKDRRIKSENQ